MDLALAVGEVEPAGAVTLAAGFLVAGPGSEAGWALLPVYFCHAANHARAALPGSDLAALAANHFRRVGDGSAARANGNGLWL